jgi:hypothetical protein
MQPKGTITQSISFLRQKPIYAHSLGPTQTPFHDDLSSKPAAFRK